MRINKHTDINRHEWSNNTAIIILTIVISTVSITNNIAALSSTIIIITPVTPNRAQLHPQTHRGIEIRIALKLINCTSNHAKKYPGKSPP
jgi:hypothetical protein